MLVAINISMKISEFIKVPNQSKDTTSSATTSSAIKGQPTQDIVPQDIVPENFEALSIFSNIDAAPFGSKPAAANVFMPICAFNVFYLTQSVGKN